MKFPVSLSRSDIMYKRPASPLRLPPAAPNIPSSTTNSNFTTEVSPTAPLPVSVCDGVSFTEAVDRVTDLSCGNRIAFLTREYSDILASRIRSNQLLARVS